MIRTKATIEPLRPDTFAQFGDVICKEASKQREMNGAVFARYVDLAQVDIERTHCVQIGLAECVRPNSFPYILKGMERHPHSSQLFYPLFDHGYIVAVAPAGDALELKDIRIFLASSDQGVNYRRDIWHMPMLGVEIGDQYLMVEQDNMEENCDVLHFTDFEIELSLPVELRDREHSVPGV